MLKEQRLARALSVSSVSHSKHATRRTKSLQYLLLLTNNLYTPSCKDVNPGGPVWAPNDPLASGEDIHRVFSEGMSFDARETVAIVGGGHAFGKAHGACAEAPCGDGKGSNTFTSGFEGAWTTNPAKWDNEFYKNLFDLEWEMSQAPSGADQWSPVGGTPSIFMLTSDLALARDPVFAPIAQEYADDQSVLDRDFAAAWYKLVTADMGPSSRCIGDLVPPAQPFQNDLPLATSVESIDYVAVRSTIEELLETDTKNSDAFINLAYRCASTFRESDYNGGCNGSRIRHAPENEWPENAGTQEALSTLEAVKEIYPEVSYTDLIILAGLTALESGNSGLDLPFCGGGVDADAGANSKDLSPRIYKDALVTVLDDYLVKGLTQEEGVALASRMYVGSSYYQKLLDGADGFSEYELALLQSEDLKAIVEMYAANESKLLETFSAAWTKMMTADRYANNRENACANVSHKTKEEDSPDKTIAIIGGTLIGAAFVLVMVIFFYRAGKSNDSNSVEKNGSKYTTDSGNSVEKNGSKYATDSDKEDNESA